MSARRLLPTFLLLALAVVSLSAFALAPRAEAMPDKPSGDASRSYDLPDVIVQPEGIAAAGRSFYTGSRANGTIAVGDVRSGDVRVLSAGGADGRDNALGLEVDGSTLWVAGGPTGRVFALDRRTGATRAVFTLTGAGTKFVNDLTISGRYLYVTDSRRAGLYRIDRRLDRPGVRRDVAAFLPFAGTPLNYVDGENNLNGIEAVGSKLVSVQSVNGKLWRIDPRRRSIREVPVAGGPLTNGDGVLRDRGSLYVVQNADKVVAKLKLRRGATSAEVVERITDPVLLFPTTIARSGDRLLLPNARFDAEPGTVPYTVGSIPRR